MTGSAAERALIGSILLSPDMYRTASELASADDFEDQRLGAIYAGIGLMLSEGVPVNAHSVGTRFADWKIRGISPSLLHELTSEVPVSYRANEFAESVRDSAVRRGLSDITRRYLDAATNPAWHSPDAVSRAIEELTALRSSAAGRQFIARKLVDVLAESDGFDWVIPGLLERRDRLILTGAEGAGKTTFVRQLAILASAGVHPLTGARIDPVKVLVVDAENTERQWRRAVRWMVREAAAAGTADPGQVVHLMAGNRIDITRENHLGEIHRLVDEHEPDILFIGPLYKLVPRAITNDDDAAPLIVALDSLRERNVALVMEAHAGKGLGQDGDRDLRPRGSSALLGWPEFGFGLNVLAEDPDIVSLRRWRGDREQRDWPRHMRRGSVGEWPWMPTVID
jgi:hypothetical protein